MHYLFTSLGLNSLGNSLKMICTSSWIIQQPLSFCNNTTELLMGNSKMNSLSSIVMLMQHLSRGRWSAIVVQMQFLSSWLMQTTLNFWSAKRSRRTHFNISRTSTRLMSWNNCFWNWNSFSGWFFTGFPNSGTWWRNWWTPTVGTSYHSRNIHWIRWQIQGVRARIGRIWSHRGWKDQIHRIQWRNAARLKQQFSCKNRRNPNSLSSPLVKAKCRERQLECTRNPL